MAASLFDSPNYAKLFPVEDAGRLFTDTAEVRAMMLVEGTLAKLQGKAGTIPKSAHRPFTAPRSSCRLILLVWAMPQDKMGSAFLDWLRNSEN